VFSGVFWPLLVYSRGHLQVKSASVYDSPLITPRFNSHPFDLSISVQSAKNWVQFFQTAPISSSVEDPQVSPAGVHTDEEWKTWFLGTAYEAAHLGGTSAMMPLKVGGVVDSKMRVYNTQNLRVIDAGILPIELTTHTQGFLYALVLRAAAIVLQDS